MSLELKEFKENVKLSTTQELINRIQFRGLERNQLIFLKIEAIELFKRDGIKKYESFIFILDNGRLYIEANKTGNKVLIYDFYDMGEEDPLSISSEISIFYSNLKSNWHREESKEKIIYIYKATKGKGIAVLNFTTIKEKVFVCVSLRGNYDEIRLELAFDIRELI